MKKEQKLKYVPPTCCVVEVKPEGLIAASQYDPVKPSGFTMKNWEDDPEPTENTEADISLPLP